MKILLHSEGRGRTITCAEKLLPSRTCTLVLTQLCKLCETGRYTGKHVKKPSYFANNVAFPIVIETYLF